MCAVPKVQTRRALQAVLGPRGLDERTFFCTREKWRDQTVYYILRADCPEMEPPKQGPDADLVVANLNPENALRGKAEEIAEALVKELGIPRWGIKALRWRSNDGKTAYTLYINVVIFAFWQAFPSEQTS